MNTQLLLFMGLAPTELLVIVLVIVLLFGGKKIPELMRGLGKGIREFNDARNTVTKEFREGLNEVSQEPKTNKEDANKIAVPSREEIQK